jgi:abhydrolase domain-containing protein 12
MAKLVSTYRAAAIIPIISPLAKFPFLFNHLSSFIQDTWLSSDRIAKYVRANEANGEKYRLTMIYDEDDYDIPWHHTSLLFWHGDNATVATGVSYEDFGSDPARK